MNPIERGPGAAGTISKEDVAGIELNLMLGQRFVSVSREKLDGVVELFRSKDYEVIEIDWRAEAYQGAPAAGIRNALDRYPQEGKRCFVVRGDYSGNGTVGHVLLKLSYKNPDAIFVREALQKDADDGQKPWKDFYDLDKMNPVTQTVE